MAKKKRQVQEVPLVPWAEHIKAIAHRYPYVLPSAIVKGLHPKAPAGMEGRIPGGAPTYPRGNY